MVLKSKDVWCTGEYLLNNAILNVDIDLLGEVIIDDLSSPDQDTHRPHAGT